MKKIVLATLLGFSSITLPLLNINELQETKPSKKVLLDLICNEYTQVSTTDIEALYELEYITTFESLSTTEQDLLTLSKGVYDKNNRQVGIIRFNPTLNNKDVLMVAFSDKIIPRNYHFDFITDYLEKNNTQHVSIDFVKKLYEKGYIYPLENLSPQDLQNKVRYIHVYDETTQNIIGSLLFNVGYTVYRPYFYQELPYFDHKRTIIQYKHKYFPKKQ